MNVGSFTVTATKGSKIIVTLVLLEGEVLYPDGSIYYVYVF